MTDLRKLLHDIRSVGLSASLHTLLHTSRRDWLDSNFLPPESNERLTQPGFIREATPTTRGMKFRFENARLEVLLLASDVVCLAWEPGIPPPAYALARRDWPGVQFTYRKGTEAYIIQTDELQITVMSDGGITFANHEGVILREELPPDRQGAKWIHHALLSESSCLYGLGERAAPLNLRGGMYVMWNADPGGTYGPGKDPIYMCMPVYLEKHDLGSYLVFYENPHPGYFTLTETAGAVFHGGMLRYFFIPGPIERALERFTELTGRPNLPPLWALGYHQSRWGYRTEEDVRSVANGFQEHDLPVSAIHLDIDHMRGYRVFTVDENRFPNLKGLAQTLEKQQVKLVSIVDPGVKKDRSYGLYQQGIQNGYFTKEPTGKPYVGLVWPGPSFFPDFTNPAVRQWWGEQYKTLLDQGISGFWHDMNEPTSFVAWGDNRLPLPLHHHLEGQTGDHRQAHNLYALNMAQAGYEGLRRLRPQHRPWIISRSGWVGIQRYAWNWTGDSETSWASLRMTIPMVLNLGLSGQPFSGPDIGGFSGNPSAELYTRWLQLAAFLPFFRTHATFSSTRREPWSFGEPTTSIVREFLRLRYKLLPYLYSLAWESSQNGKPLIRPLFWPDRSERWLWEVDDAFLVGDCLLVAPVLQEAAAQRSLSLPPGDWYDFWSGQRYHGGPEAHVLPVTLERIPLFARAGSLLPLAENTETLRLILYAPPAGTEEQNQIALRLYADAGEGYPEAPLGYRIDLFNLRQTGRTLTLERDIQGGYPFSYQHIIIEVVGAEIESAQVDGAGAAFSENQIRIPSFRKLQLTLTT